MDPHLSPATASRFANLALGHLTREYPNKLDHVLRGPADLQGPRALHPVFYGSFDWHSSVHGHWLLARLLRLFPSLPEAPQIRAVLSAHFTAADVAAEVAYARAPGRGTFERTYGWAWILELAAELARHTTPEGRTWHRIFAPLAEEFAARFQAFLPRATYPIRAGTHASSAFGIALALDYADSCAVTELAHALREKARSWYGGDRDCQAWEPGGDDFLSPALIEAECMRRVLPGDAFAAWLEAFLPRLAEGAPATLFEPVVVADRTDGKICHLDGLNLSRAWCMRALGSSLAPEDPRSRRLVLGAERHLAASLPHVSGDYMGEHWLASFALLALDPVMPCTTEPSAIPPTR